MSLKNTATRYGLVAMLLHWSMALLIIGLLGLGLYMTSLPDGDPKWGWYDLHKSFGVVVWCLVVARIVWRLRNPPPALPDSMPAWEKLVAHAGHAYLYLAMVVLPLTGYVDASAGGFHLAFFGLFDFPMLIAKNQTLFEAVVLIHRYTAYGLILVLAGHIGAALKHHFIVKDDVLRRMLP